MKRLPQNTKLRIIHGPVSVYTTAKKIRNGLGDFIKFNAATQKALDAMEFMRQTEPCVGLCGTWEGLSIQIDIIKE